MDSILKASKTFDNEITMSELFLNETLADVKFLLEGDTKIPAHRLILSMKSPFFRQLFYDDCYKGNIFITDISPEAFTEFLQIFYLDKVTLTGGNIETVMDLAVKYDAPQCIAVCSKFLKDALSPDNTLWIYEMAQRYLCMDLITHCKDKIQIDPKSIFDAPSFRKCGHNLLRDILSINLDCDELTVFNACIDWSKNVCERENIVGNIENYKKVLGDCFYLIRFPVMNNKEFCSVLESHRCIFDIDMLTDILLYITLDRPLKVVNQFSGECRQKELNVLRYHNDSEACEHTIQPEEVMQFLTNQPIILKGIVINETIHDLINCEVDGNINIYNDVSKDESLILVQSVVLSKQNNNYYKFLRPIAIYPHQKHKIQIIVNPSSKGRAFPVKIQQYVKTLNLDDVEFKFEPSSDEKYDSVHYGLISGLRFVKNY